LSTKQVWLNVDAVDKTGFVADQRAWNIQIYSRMYMFIPEEGEEASPYEAARWLNASKVWNCFENVGQ
jgi:hypothetical protein